MGWSIDMGMIVGMGELLRKPCLIGLAALVCGGAAWAAEVSYVPAREYAAVAEREIDGARASVEAYLYLFAYYPNQPRSGPARLAQALARARERGVRVEVVLERGGQTGAPENREAGEFLLRHGVSVSYVDGAVLHAKGLVVDGRTVLAGSSNWSAAAFEQNAEVNLLARSTEAARALTAEMAAVPRVAAPAAMAEETLAVPLALLEPGRLGEMVTAKDDRALDAYLYFLRMGVSTAAFTAVEREPFQTAMGWPAARRARPQMFTLLKRLRDRYGLIDVVIPRKTPPEVRLRPLALTAAVGLPTSYFRHGWDRRLGFAAKAFLLLGLKEEAEAPTGRWSLSREALGERYGVSAAFLQDGITALRRADLLEVEHSEIALDGGPRFPNTYRLRAFYDPAERRGRLAALEEGHGAAAVKRARKIAALVYEDGDVDLVETLVALEERYGRELVGRAAAVLGEKSVSNPKRNGAYLIGTVRRMGDGGG